MPPRTEPVRCLAATYDYQDEEGTLLFEVVRYEPKADRLGKLRSATGPDGQPAPVPLPLEDDPRPGWKAFYDEWGVAQAEADGDLAAAFSKLEGYAARLSLLHHLCETDGAGPVTKASIEAGCTRARWFAAEAARVYAALGESRERRQERELVELVRRKGGELTPRELMRHNPRRYTNGAVAEAALDGLVSDGLGEWQ
jgi:hypothetical protein